MRRLRIPKKEEIETILNWGGIRLVIGIGQLGFYATKQIARLALHCLSGLERFYYQVIVEPFDALIWVRAEGNLLEAQVVEVLPDGIKPIGVYHA